MAVIGTAIAWIVGGTVAAVVTFVVIAGVAPIGASELLAFTEPWPGQERQESETGRSK